MAVRNVARFPIIVNLYCAKKFGDDHMVMPGEVEDPLGPLLLELTGGEKVHMKLVTNFVVTDSGNHDPVAGVLVVSRGRPTSLTWKQGDTEEGIRVRHFLD